MKLIDTRVALSMHGFIVYKQMIIPEAKALWKVTGGEQLHFIGMNNLTINIEEDHHMMFHTKYNTYGLSPLIDSFYKPCKKFDTWGGIF